MLADDQNMGLQKILLYNLQSPVYLSRTSRHFVMIKEESLLSDDGIPSWALAGNRKLMLWLHGLRYLRSSQERKQEIMRKWRRCKSALEGRRDAKYFARVGDFILNSRSFEGCTDHDGGRGFIFPWTVLINVVQVKSSLRCRSRENQVFLELLLLSVVGDSFASTLRNLQIKKGAEEVLGPFCNWWFSSCQQAPIQLFNWWSSGSAFDAFREWLSDFDFSTVLNMFHADKQIEYVTHVMIQVICLTLVLTVASVLNYPQVLSRATVINNVESWTRFPE